MRRQVAVVVLALLTAGCATSTGEKGRDVVLIGSGTPAQTPYAGPMSLTPDYSDKASVAERSGAAARALECDGEPFDGGGGAYDSGLEEVQDAPELAVEDFLVSEGVLLPESGYVVERDDGDRVLISYDVGGRTKVAFITADGTRDYLDDVGWGVESWSQCDPAELPLDVAEGLGYGVWLDVRDRPVPVAEISSFPGSDHCDWQDITFLQLGEWDEGEQYLRDAKGELADYLRTTFDGHAALPRGAVDSGYHRDGRELWLVPDKSAAYLVSLVDQRDVERWPAAKEQIGCA